MQNIQKEDNFQKNFNLNSLVPLLLFILGIYIMYLILKKDNSSAFLTMIISFVIYIVNNISTNIKGNSTLFNEFLEDLGAFFVFGINLILFGIIFYKGNLIIMLVIFFFSICLVLSMARSWVLHQKNTVGFPIALNGLFFPLIYYFYIFYLQELGSSIFIIYYFIIAVLSISKTNFIAFEQNIEKEIKNKKLEEDFFGKENLEKKELEENLEKNKNLKNENNLNTNDENKKHKIITEDNHII